MEVARLAHAVNFASVDDDADRVWGPTKTNLIPWHVKGILFQVRDLPFSTVFPDKPDPDQTTSPFIEWGGECDLRAEEIAAIQTQRDKGQRKKKVDQCKDVLEEYQGDWTEGNVIKRRFDASDRTWDRARKETGVETRQVKGPNGQVKEIEWLVPDGKTTPPVI